MTCLQHIKNHIKNKQKKKKSKSLSTMPNHHGRVVTLHDHLTFLLSLTATAFAIISIMNIIDALTKYGGVAFWTIIIGYMAILALYQERKRLEEEKSSKKKDDNTQQQQENKT